jgi:hypothetical protein
MTMDTVTLVKETLDELALKHEFEPLTGVFSLWFRDGDERFAILIQTTSGAAILHAPYLAGPSEHVDPFIAGFAAVLAHALDLHIGVDPSDGEVVARARVELAVVEPALRAPLLARAITRFLRDQSRARAELRAAREDRPTSPAPIDLAALGHLRPSA